VALITITACQDTGRRPVIDGSVPIVDVHVPAQCPQLPDRSGFNFLGEACVADPFPVNTECHDGAGWCIAGTCRPQSSIKDTSCPACPAGTEHFAPAGAGYCAL